MLIVSASRSTATHRRPILWATADVVPEPTKGSSTMSPGFVAMWMMRCKRRSGLGVEKGARSGPRETTSALAFPVVPISVCGHMVTGTSPAATSVRNFLTLGTPCPALPKEIRLSRSNSSYRDSVYSQQRPGGGVTTLPDGVTTSKNWAARRPFSALACIGNEAQTPLGSLSGFSNRASCSSLAGSRFRTSSHWLRSRA